jgi:hypothetical protein
MMRSVVLRNSSFADAVTALGWASKCCGESILLHLEISSIFKGDLDALLFRILVLGSVSSSDGEVWHRSDVKEIVLELPSGWQSGASPSSLLNILPQCLVACTPREILKTVDEMAGASALQRHQYCLGSAASGRSNLDPDVWRDRNFQLAARHLYFHQNKLLDYADPRVDPEGSPWRKDFGGLPADECLRAVLRAVQKVSGDTDPMWEGLTVFWKFAASEMSLFGNNCYLGTGFAEDLPGFRNFVFEQFLETSRDFVLSIKPVAGEQGKGPFDLSRYAPNKVWQEQNLSYVITHQNHFSFFNLRVLQRGAGAGGKPGMIILSDQLFAALTQYHVEMNPNYENRARDLLLKDLAGILNVQTDSPDSTPVDPDPFYILSLDNIKKMMAIYLRMRAGLPVIIQGETGCG